VNAGGHGYYRARYSPELLAALQAGLHSELSPVERFGLINDAWATTMAGRTSLTDYLNLIELLREETDLSVWTTMIGSCHHLNRILDEAQCVSLRDRLRAILSPAVERHTWAPRPGETELEGQLRGDLIGALGILGEEQACQQRARALFTDYEKDASAVDRNVVPALVAIVAHTGAGADYENFFKRFKTAETPQEETRYLFALANFRDEKLIEQTLQLTVNGEVRTQNAPYLMRNILLNKDARERAWGFMKASWETMLRLYPDNSIPRMCEGIIGLVTAELAADVEDFFGKHPVKQGAKQMEQHLERLCIAVACKERWKNLLRT
jgi:puromycin-sensitive aminopeptidase